MGGKIEYGNVETNVHTYIHTYTHSKTIGAHLPEAPINTPGSHGLTRQTLFSVIGCAHIHTYIHTHIHTYTHTHT